MSSTKSMAEQPDINPQRRHHRPLLHCEVAVAGTASMEEVKGERRKKVVAEGERRKEVTAVEGLVCGGRKGGCRLGSEE